LAPVRGFYEWQAQPPDWQRTVRHYITVNDQKLFCFAGSWDRSTKPDGTLVESVTIITMPGISQLQVALMANPEAGDLIEGTGGLRKLRFGDSRRSKGKRGGLRVIYY
jgi:hypothetical protein